MTGELGILLGLKLRIFANAVRSVRREPPLKSAVVASFVAAWGIGGFYLFHEGLTFVRSFPGIGDYLTARLFYLFSLAVFIMLAFSSALLSYPVLYGRRENELLFSMPLPVSAIVSCKLWESIFLSSWAFVIMTVPLMLAYFTAGGYGTRLFFLAWIYFLPLAVVSGAIGLLSALLIGCLAPRLSHRRTVLLAAAALLLAAVWWAARGSTTAAGDQSLRFVNQLMSKCNLAAWFLFPSSWAVDGILSVARGAYGRALFLWAVLLSNALFLFSLCGVAGEALLERGWNLHRGGAAGRVRVSGRTWVSTRSPLAALVAKDILTFIRDPAQWGQFALFFGLLGIYIVNLRNLPYEIQDKFWRYLLFTLNLSGLGLTLAGLSSRFFFPLISLELRQFWLLGLCPLSRAEILVEKYLLCTVFTVAVTCALAVLSGVMLGVSLPLLLGSVAAVVCMGVAISALSVGLGAAYPNPAARSSAEAISGLGGTMVLVLNLVYISAALVIEGYPLFLNLRGRIGDSALPVWMIGSGLVLAAVSAATAFLSLRAGRRKLERIEL